MKVAAARSGLPLDALFFASAKPNSLPESEVLCRITDPVYMQGNVVAARDHLARSFGVGGVRIVQQSGTEKAWHVYDQGN